MKATVKDVKKSRQGQLYLVIAIFALLVTISYRNSLINEEFNSMQNLKKELANVEKENKQLEIGIEGSFKALFSKVPVSVRVEFDFK